MIRASFRIQQQLCLLFVLLVVGGIGCAAPERQTKESSQEVGNNTGTNVAVEADGNAKQDPVDAKEPIETKTTKISATGPAEPAPHPDQAEDPCAAFERERKNALTPEEHMGTFGCPPCPCSCVGGKISCAPCAACGAFHEGPGPGLEPAPPDTIP